MSKQKKSKREPSYDTEVMYTYSTDESGNGHHDAARWVKTKGPWVYVHVGRSNGVTTVCLDGEEVRAIPKADKATAAAIAECKHVIADVMEGRGKTKRPATVMSIKEHERIVKEHGGAALAALEVARVYETQEAQLCELVNALFDVQVTTIAAACKQVKRHVAGLKSRVEGLEAGTVGHRAEIERLHQKNTGNLETAAKEMEFVQKAVAAMPPTQSNARQRLREDEIRRELFGNHGG